MQWAHAKVLTKAWQDVVSNQDSFKDLMAHVMWLLEKWENGATREFEPLQYAFHFRQM